MNLTSCPLLYPAINGDGMFNDPRRHGVGEIGLFVIYLDEVEAVYGLTVLPVFGFKQRAT